MKKKQQLIFKTLYYIPTPRITPVLEGVELLNKVSVISTLFSVNVVSVSTRWTYTPA